MVTSRLAIAVAALLGVLGCRSVSTRADSPCALPAGIDAPWLAPGHVLMLGEQHRTFECPRFAARVLCAASESQPVILGLEIWGSEQARLDAFLEDGDAARLIEGGFWQRPSSDGRDSQAMLELIQRVRALRQRGRAIQLVALDVEPEGDRDRAMATSIEKARSANPDATLLVLIGNAHARKTLAVHKPVAWHLVADGVPVVSVNLAPGVATPDAYDRELQLGPFTEAPRAREVAR